MLMPSHDDAGGDHCQDSGRLHAFARDVGSDREKEREDNCELRILQSTKYRDTD